MKYQQHDFIANIIQYQKTGQDDKVRKLVMDELAQLIHYHRGHVITALNHAGIPTTKDATDSELVKKISDNIGTNQKLNRSLSSLLALLNTPKAGAVIGGAGMKLNAAGNPACPCDTYSLWGKCLCPVKKSHNANGGYYGSDGMDKSLSGGAGASAGVAGALGSSNPVNAISSAIGNIFGFAKSKVDAKTQADANRQQLAQQLLANKQATGSTSSKTGLYVFIAIVATGAIAYFAFGRKKSTMPSASGSGHQAPTSATSASAAPASGTHAHSSAS